MAVFRGLHRCVPSTCGNARGNVDGQEFQCGGDGREFNQAMADSQDVTVTTCCRCAEGYAGDVVRGCRELACGRANAAAEAFACGEGAVRPTPNQAEKVKVRAGIA